MARYFVRPSTNDDDDWLVSKPLIPHLDVPDHESTDTGLVDKNGNSIMRAPRPIGFGRDREW
jgi:hypothetical protein